MEITGGPRRRRPAGAQRALLRVPVLAYRANLGVLLGHRFVLINHTGRVTGKPRQTVVEVAARDPRTGAVTVVSGYGPGSDWYRNLLAHPGASIRIGRRSLDVRAVPLGPGEAAEVMVDYAGRHPRAALRLARFMGFRVNGTDEDYRAVGRSLPVLRLEPRT